MNKPSAALPIFSFTLLPAENGFFHWSESDLAKKTRIVKTAPLCRA